ncbi:MAG TPA: ABC transporter substrate-binding protein [Ktedonobacteraceae bacterium]|nr:ABC transporter substrate-binding protein [Ktedonobacteraceae bacterium]
MSAQRSSSNYATTKTAIIFISLFAIFTLLLSACGGGGSSSSTKKADTLWIGEVGDQYVDNFNPYAGGSGGPPTEMIYESLIFTNLAKGTMNPWLASNWKFSPDNKQLTFTLQNNVKWNDGQPFTADDVAFTLNLMKQYPGMDVSAIWQYLTSVTAPDAHTVVVNFKAPNTPVLWYIGRLQMLPKHIWSTVGDPIKYIDTKAVGTGPFTVKTFDPQIVTLTKNPNYWQPGKPTFSQIKYPIYKSNDTLLLNLISNQLDQANIFAPNLDKNFVQRDPANHHYWLVPNDTVMFYPNNAKKPFNQLAVRQAISLALDRDTMSKVAENGYEQVANPTALILPNAKDYVAPQYANLTFKHDVQQARQVLENAGYKKGSDGIYIDQSGSRLAFQIDVPSNFSDRVRLCQIAAENLKEAGMDVSVNTMSSNDWYNHKQLGQYDVTIDSDGGGFNPYYYFNRTLNSVRSAPIGKNSQSNFARWQDPTTDNLLKQFAATSDPNIQKQAIQSIEKIFVEQVPTIPLLDAPQWFEYNSSRFTGWPSKDNPYTTATAPEQIVLNLEPR